MIVFGAFPAFEALVQQVRASPIPIVIIADPVRWGLVASMNRPGSNVTGLVASMNRPGGNVTGINTMLAELPGKHLGLLRDLVPKAATITALVDPSLPRGETITLPDARNAAAALGAETACPGSEHSRGD